MKKNNSIKINCSSEEKESIRKQANKLGLSLQEFILKVCLNVEIAISIKSR